MPTGKKIEKLPEVDDTTRLFAGMNGLSDIIVLWDKINEIVEVLNENRE